MSVVAIAATAACSQVASPGAGVEQVTFANDGVVLAGEIHSPDEPGRLPGVVLVHGSGPVTRGGNGPLIEPFLSRGIAVLVYDKRGTGQSGGGYRGVGPFNSDSMIRLLAGDAVAALELLKRHGRIDADRLGLAGGSQAGWIIPNAAARFPIRFAVILSGPLISVGEEIHYSEAFEGSALPLALADSVMATFAGFRGYDPVPDLRSAHGAIHWVLGALDRSIPAVRSAQIARTLIAELNRPSWRVEVLPTGNHSLFDEATGRALDFFPAVQQWLAERLR